METVEPAVWSAHERDLLARIEAHPFECAGQILDFTRRLARDHGWSLDFARGAIREYRRFCFLAMVFDTPVTPSEEVDEVWHQHLTHSRDYWGVWCGQVLRGSLHHDPTEGGPAEQARYREQYAQTLARYEAFFGPPDILFWPAAHRRFRGRPRFRSVDTDRVYVVPKPLRSGWVGRGAAIFGFASAGLLADPAPALAQAFNPLDWTAEPFLTLYVALFVAALVFVLVQDRNLRKGSGRAPLRDLDLVELAWLAGGRERAAGAVILGFLDAKAARFNQANALGHSRGRPELVIDDRGVPLAPPFEPYRGLVRGEVSHKTFVGVLGPRLDGVASKLAGRGLVPSGETLARIRRLVLFAFGSVVALGLLKVVVGLARDKPVGFLVLLIVFTLVIGAMILFRQEGRTQFGDETLAAYREQHSRAASSPRESELLFAFALTGAAVLAGTHLAEYQRLHSRSDGGSGCSSGGGDGGGGGCGGCGGGD